MLIIIFLRRQFIFYLDGAETWTLRKVYQKYLDSFEIWCWRRMEKISWTDHVRNEEVLQRVKEQRNIIQFLCYGLQFLCSVYVLICIVL